MRIFRDLDMVEQLGSGIPRILARYPETIYHFTTKFIRLVIPYAHGFDGANDQDDKLIACCQQPRFITEMMDYLGLKHRTYFRRKILNPLLDMGRLELTIPDKPKSPKQKYRKKDNQIK
ncbi:MAG: hypothetical protein Q9M15_00770 [Mariprofundaceae bacterium]|nr:hypothetical protein [Mariprofundaceae bacterium]